MTGFENGQFLPSSVTEAKKKDKYYSNDTPRVQCSSPVTEEHILIMEVLILTCCTMKQRYNNDQGSKWQISPLQVSYSVSISP